MVFIFSLLLISGIVGGQVVDLSPAKELLGAITSVCLAYIMIEVGLEFSVDPRRVQSYGWDAVVSFLAAILPAILWLIYFLLFFSAPWQSAVLAALSCAPTSAGVLFSMMMAAGLGATWVFRKARTLAVLDDLATILLLSPLQMVIAGFHPQSVIVLILIGSFIYASFRWRNSIPWPAGGGWMFLYALGLTAIISFLRHSVHIHLEVLIPAFMWGCLLRLPPHHQAPAPQGRVGLDVVVKGMFMLLVGLSFPRVTLGDVPLAATAGHVLALTFLSNLGKCFPLLCYRREVPLRERLALSITMFPRGEVGAAVLLIGLGYGFSGYVTTLAMLSLAFNLVLTGMFVALVIKLLRGVPVRGRVS